MRNSELAQAERRALCELLLTVGPGYPTLCEGWRAVDLAAHLVVRERRPLAGPGIVLGGPFARYTQRAMNRAIDRHSFEALVEVVRSGPPRLLRGVDGPMNLIEYFIHHEDLRRGAEAVSPREDLEALDDALWAQSPRRFTMMTRKLRDVDLTLRDPGRGDLHIGGGDRSAIIAGPASEIVLYLFGRRDAAHVELDGDESAVAELRTGALGI